MNTIAVLKPIRVRRVAPRALPVVFLGAGLTFVVSVATLTLLRGANWNVLMVAVMSPLASFASLVLLAICGVILARGEELDGRWRAWVHMALAFDLCVGAAAVLSAFTRTY